MDLKSSTILKTVGKKIQDMKFMILKMDAFTFFANALR